MRCEYKPIIQSIFSLEKFFPETSSILPMKDAEPGLTLANLGDVTQRELYLLMTLLIKSLLIKTLLIMTLLIKTLPTKTLLIMTLLIKTLPIKTLLIMTLLLMALLIKLINVTLHLCFYLPL